MRRTLRTFVAACGLALATLAMQPTATHAERYVQFIEGYRCEVSIEASLGKFVCRAPNAPYRDWFVMLFDFDYNQNRVFMDVLHPNGSYSNGNMSFAEFERRFGR